MLITSPIDLCQYFDILKNSFCYFILFATKVNFLPVIPTSKCFHASLTLNDVLLVSIWCGYEDLYNEMRRLSNEEKRIPKDN
jgi:hypothetical protein